MGKRCYLRGGMFYNYIIKKLYVQLCSVLKMSFRNTPEPVESSVVIYGETSHGISCVDGLRAGVMMGSLIGKHKFPGS